MMTSDDKVGGWVKKGQNHDDVILEWSLMEYSRLKRLPTAARRRSLKTTTKNYICKYMGYLFSQQYTTCLRGAKVNFSQAARPRIIKGHVKEQVLLLYPSNLGKTTVLKVIHFPGPLCHIAINCTLRLALLAFLEEQLLMEEGLEAQYIY